MGFMDKAVVQLVDLAEQAMDKASPLLARAVEIAAKGLDAAASSVDRATDGRYHEQIETVSNRLEAALNRGR